jgi:LPS sulfotransferase NodH
MSNVNTRVIVVTGLMRSGTSMLMQCLAAAGIKCIGNAPGYEDPRTVEEGILPREVMLDAQGGALKVLEPHCRLLPSGFEYYVIATDRNKREQAKSYLKFIKAYGKRISVKDGAAIKKLKDMLVSHQEQADVTVNDLTCPVTRVNFENLVSDPIRALARIADDLGLDLKKLASPIVKRGPECMKKMLEVSLINGKTLAMATR